VGSDYDYNLASLVAGALTIFAIVPVKRSHTFLAKAQIFGPSGRLFATRELHQTVNVVGGGIIFTMLVTPIVAAVGTNLKTYGNFGTVIEDVSGLFAKDIQVWLNRQSKALKTFYKRVKGVVVRPPELPSAVCGVCAAPGIAARQSKL
jgi:hypothetical protein